MRKTIPSGALALLLAAAPAAAGVASVWAVGDGDKVARDGARSPLAKGNAVWDGRTVRLAAARNEIVAFQVIVEADGSGIRALSAALPELRRRGGSERIAYAPPAKDPTLYAGRPIQLFSVRDMNVTQETHASWAWTPGSPAAPKHTVGWQPVQLVPENARAGRGGFPLAVGPGLLQAIWIEVYVGRELPAGTYEGTVTLTADGATRSLPVELRVFGFTLPDANSLPGDGLLRALPARALPGPEPRPRLPPLRPPPADRARARLRRGQGRGDPGAFRRERLHGEGRLRGPRRGRRQHDRPRLLLRDGPRVRAEGERLEALRRLDGVRGADPAEGPDLPLPARRALPAAVPGSPAPRRQRALEPGPGGVACRSSSPRPWCRSSPA